MIEFKTEFKLEFILLGTDSRKVLEIVHGYSLKEKMHLLINAYLLIQEYFSYLLPNR